MLYMLSDEFQWIKKVVLRRFIVFQRGSRGFIGSYDKCGASRGYQRDFKAFQGVPKRFRTFQGTSGSFRGV